jgi:polyisoprenoid-binding protein YceI
MQKSAKYALIAVLAIIVVGGAGFYWFFLRDDAPKRASLLTTSTPQETDGTGLEPTSAAGRWKIEQTTGVFVGYRVEELFGGSTIKVTAVGRTPAVTGAMTVAGTNITGTEITAADIIADVTKLTSDKGARDQQIKSRGLETDTFGTAEFKLTQPITLPGTPVKGVEVDVTATGELTLHGQTKTVEIPLQAKWNGRTITMAGNAKLAFTDYGITAPTNAIVSVDENGEFELQLTFVPS